MVETDTWKFQALLSRVEICKGQGMTRVWLQSQASRLPARASSFCWPSKACVWLDASNLVRGEFRSFDEFSIFSNFEQSYISWNHNHNLALLSKALRPLGNSAPTCRGFLVQLTYVNSDSTACFPQDTTNNMLSQASSFSILSVANVFVMAAYIVAEYAQIVAIQCHTVVRHVIWLDTICLISLYRSNDQIRYYAYEAFTRGFLSFRRQNTVFKFSWGSCVVTA